MKTYTSKINKDTYVLIERETNEVLEEYTQEESGKKFRELFEQKLESKFMVEKKQFKHLSSVDKQEELLHRIEQYKTDFDNKDHDGRAMRDIFVLDRQQYEFVIELLKGNEKTLVKPHLKTDKVDNALSLLTEKEKLALRESLQVIYLDDKSDYINGLWDVIRAIIGDQMDEDEFNVEEWLTKLKKD